MSLLGSRVSRLTIESSHGIYAVTTPKGTFRSQMLDSAVADARKAEGIPEFEVSSNFEMAEVLSSLLGDEA